MMMLLKRVILADNSCLEIGTLVRQNQQLLLQQLLPLIQLSIKAEALQNRVSLETDTVFDDAFWENLDVM